MTEFLLTLLQSVIIAAVPVITAFVCSYIHTKNVQAKQNIDSEEAKNLLDDAERAVTTAVISTNQTYVDTLKQSGQFTVENQKEAFQKSFDTAMSIMTQEAKDFIEKAYGSLTDWLTTQIEAKVKVNKSAPADPTT
ncbi:MAG: hypothetical protein IJD35_06095 [Clostridia bacterium]|nr:hypothetical protein [Clostridia bacterium]